MTATAAPVMGIEEIGRRARVAAQTLASSTSAVKDTALLAAADAVHAAVPTLLEANRADLEAATADGVRGALLDRLKLTEARIASMVKGLRDVAALPDPVGETVEGWRRPNGLDIRRVRVPLGVVAVIYEARPNVTSDVAALCLKSGNASILRGSSTALRSNRAIVEVLRPAIASAGLPEDSVQLVPDVSREGAISLMRLREHIDLLVPRGGPALIQQILDSATVPFIIDGDGNCHVYVDARADLEKARRIVLNAKLSKPSVCNAAEKLLVHEAIAEEFLPGTGAILQSRGVELRGDEMARRLVPSMIPASEEDWKTEYLDLIMGVRVVSSLDEAVDHVRRYGSGHTEAIITEDLDAARRFISECPSAVVMVNASTRFTDGGEFGLGAEIGIATQKLHARGPMGLRELTTYRLEVWGDGHIRE